MKEHENEHAIANLVSMLQGCGTDIPLSKFVEINFSIFQEFRKIYLPQKRQAEIATSAIGKPVSVSSLAVTLARLNGSTKKGNSNVIIMEKKISTRFVSKDAKLIFGTQKEKVKVTKNGIIQFEDKLIDWRGIAPNESISSWIQEYKDKLIAINLTGWRWSQIAEAINEHLSLSKKISANTLTSVITLANKKFIK